MDLAGVVGVVGLAALVTKAMSLVKYVSARNWNGVATQGATWVAGVGATFVYGASAWANTIVVGDVPLTDMNGWSKVIVGVTVGSGASLVYDFKKARDNTDSASEPPLLR